MFTYTAWPTIDDVYTLASSIQNVDPTKLDYRLSQGVLDAVSRDIQQKTRRQFIAATATRNFNGSGTGVLDVDEFVSVSAVTILGYTAATPLTLTNWYAEDDNLYPKTRIDIYQGGPAAMGIGYYTAFPKGRMNIGVTANWGYASTIPADLWMAHAEESAARLCALVIVNPTGRLKSWREGDATSESYELDLPGDVAGWHNRYLSTVYGYVSPKVNTPPMRKAVMI